MHPSPCERVKTIPRMNPNPHRDLDADPARPRLPCRAPGRIPAPALSASRRWSSAQAARPNIHASPTLGVIARFCRAWCRFRELCGGGEGPPRHRAHRYFDDTAAWLACVTSRTTITQLMRISWRTTGRIVTRVSAEIEAGLDRFAGLRRIGIDEISCKKGHKYLVVVVDHDSGRLVWAAPGRDKKTVHAFSGALGAERSAALTHVSADGAGFIAGVVTQRAPPQSSAPTPFMPASWLCRCCRCQAVQGR